MGLDTNAIEQSFIENMKEGYAAAGNPEDFTLSDAQMIGKALAKTIVDHLSSTAVVKVEGAVDAFAELPTSATAVTDENPPWPRFQAWTSSGTWLDATTHFYHQVTFASAMSDANYTVVITPNGRVTSTGGVLADFGWVYDKVATGFKIGYDDAAASLANMNTGPLRYYYMAFYEENWDLDNGLDVDVTLNAVASDIHGAFNGTGTIE
jgi:hypothetical protein